MKIKCIYSHMEGYHEVGKVYEVKEVHTSSLYKTKQYTIINDKGKEVEVPLEGLVFGFVIEEE